MTEIPESCLKEDVKPQHTEGERGHSIGDSTCVSLGFFLASSIPSLQLAFGTR